MFRDAVWWASQISSSSTVLDESLALRISSVDESKAPLDSIGKSSTFVKIHVEAYMLTLCYVRI